MDVVPQASGRSGWGAADGDGRGERIVVALRGGPGTDRLLQRAAALGDQGGSAELVGVHVVASDARADASSSELVALRRQTAAAGVALHTVIGPDVAEALLQFTTTAGGTQLVLGVDPRRALRPFRTGTTASVLRAGTIDVHLVPVPVPGRTPAFSASRHAFSPRRRMLGWVAALALPAIATVISLSAGELIGPSSAALVFMLAVVGVALIGGLPSALVAVIGATLLLNYYFTPPLHSFAVVEPRHFVALVLLLIAAVLVALVVHAAARRGEQAVRARAEAALLTEFATAVMTRPDPLPSLLDRVREAFGARAVALLERAPEGWRHVAAAGAEPVPPPDEAEVDVAVDDGLHLVLTGRHLSAGERHVLRGVAGQAVLGLRAQRLTAEAQEAKRRAEATELRSALLSAVGHDLRTPLTAIKAAAGSLRDPGLRLSPADTATQLATVEECADRLQALVDNLLDSARLTTGAVQPQLRTIDYEDVLARALATLDADHRIGVEIDDRTPAVLADPGLLERIVANLVANALTHGRACGVVARAVDRGTTVELRISDRGPGLPADRIESMFAPFQRRGDRDATSGIGLGLAVARGFAEAMGGTLTALPTPGGGLTMVVTLPADPAASSAPVTPTDDTAAERAR
jgi:two-component system sensor histidine kinase KdpD